MQPAEVSKPTTFFFKKAFMPGTAVVRLTIHFLDFLSICLHVKFLRTGLTTH